MRKFNEQPFWGQLGIIATMIGTLGIPFGSIFIYAGDAKLNEKYATDADLRSIQQKTDNNIREIKSSVQENTRAVKDNANAVDSLTLIVTDQQIEKLEVEIRRLERKPQLSDIEASGLSSKKRALRDLTIQRDKIYERLQNRFNFYQ